MRLVRVKWGKLLFELPGEILLFLLFKAFLWLHNINQRLQQPPSGSCQGGAFYCIGNCGSIFHTFCYYLMHFERCCQCF